MEVFTQSLPWGSKEELGRKLDQTRICSRSGAGDDAEIRIVAGAAGRVWRRELGAIQQVEKLHA
jgi:hypothetical protein